MLGLIIALACFILVGLFALMNQGVDPATLQINLGAWGAWKTEMPAWLLILLSLFAGAVLTFLASHGREAGFRRRVREKERELEETKAHLHKVEDALLQLLPRRVEEARLGSREEELPPEDAT